MTVKKLSCEAENCPFGGELPYDRRSGLSFLKEKVLAWALGALISLLCFIGYGAWGELKTLVKEVQSLSVSVATTIERQTTTGKDVDRLRVELGAMRVEMDQFKMDALQHAREDKQRFTAVVRERVGR